MNIPKQEILDKALKIADWIERNQIKDRHDANRGRTIRCYDKKTGFCRLTGNWQTGIAAMGLLAAYRRTGEERYLKAAELAGRYILSLQAMDQSEPQYYGTIRELTPQSIEFAPRDSTTAAWALIWLYHATENPLYLKRAVLFGKWHVQYGMHEDWPLYACYMDPKFEDFYAQGAFQSGTGLFYHDLFMFSGQAVFIEKGFKPIAVRYRDSFFNKDGSIILTRDPFTGKIIPGNINDSHKYNDDFGTAMLQGAADFFQEESFRKKAYKFALWLAAQQNEDGGFGDIRHSAAVPVSLMYFHDLGNHYRDTCLIKARDLALKKLLDIQFSNTGDSRIDGALLGRYEGEAVEGAGEICVNTRTTAYALIALLKIESEIDEIWLGRYNRQFKDPLFQGGHNLIW